MAVNLQEMFASQLDELVTEYAALEPRLKSEKGSYRLATDISCFITRARAAVDRIAGPTSPHTRQVEETLATAAADGWKAIRLGGVVSSLRADLAAGYLDSARELIHGELFSDFLEMAAHLLDEGYKDAAAVIAGSALEAHLRALAETARVEVDKSDGKRKKSSRLNDDLAGAGVYGKFDHKSILGWLDLRNNAAHGDYDRYDAGQVENLISGIRNFIARNPA